MTSFRLIGRGPSGRCLENAWLKLQKTNCVQRDLLFQCVARLERTARKAEESGQFAVVVGCVAQLNKMLSLGADQRGFRGHPSHSYRR